MVVILKADKENYDSLQSPIPRFKAMASGIGKVRGKKNKGQTLVLCYGILNNINVCTKFSFASLLIIAPLGVIVSMVTGQNQNRTNFEWHINDAL